MLDVKQLGQVFTPKEIVDLMLSLKLNSGMTLEPAAGDGAFVNRIDNCVGVEIDSRYINQISIINIDFFAFPQERQFNTIIGNPPYVRYQDIPDSTKNLLTSTKFNKRSNLYLFFIEKCVNHLVDGGELIFITPRDFIKSASSCELNKWLFQSGTITHVIDLGDVKVFKEHTPNCLIWRFQKGRQKRGVYYFAVKNKNDIVKLTNNPEWDKRWFHEENGQMMFAKKINSLDLRNIAHVKVGAVSGADTIFTSLSYGNVDFVCSNTVTTGLTRKMIYKNEPDDWLMRNKKSLLERKIRSFDESNWWEWGRGCSDTVNNRVYVNTKTRQNKPFFTNKANHFDGSLLGIFPKKTDVDLEEFAKDLNSVNWGELGFLCNDRFIFSQSSLQNVLLPDSFEKYLK